MVVWPPLLRASVLCQRNPPAYGLLPLWHQAACSTALIRAEIIATAFSVGNSACDGRINVL